MSWLYSRALVAEFSADTCSDGEPSAQLSGTPTPQAYYSHGRTTAASRRFRFGTTSKLLTDDRGEALLTSFREASRAKTLAPQVAGQELTASEAECGHTWRASLATYDRATHSWETPQCSLLEGLDAYSETWPRWGMMRNGECYPLPMLVRRTCENESGSLLPTPTTIDTGSRFNKSASAGAKLRPTLGAMARFAMWPTPTAKANMMAPSMQKWPAHRNLWPTPTAHNAKELNAPSEAMRNTPTLSASVGGRLNPTWVEWLMGWPLGWTDCAPLETDKFQLWRRSHGAR